MGLEVLQCLLVGHLLKLLHVLAQERVISILKDNSWLFLKLEHGEVLNVFPHQGCGLSDGALIGNSAVGHLGDVGYSSIPCAHVLLEVFLETGHFFIWFGLDNFLFDTFGNELAELEFGFLFCGFNVSFSQCSSCVLRNLSLHFLDFFFCVVFLLFDILILVSNLSLLIRESLLPGWLNKTEELVFAFLLFAEQELISLRNGLDSPQYWCCQSHLFYLLFIWEKLYFLYFS